MVEVVMGVGYHVKVRERHLGPGIGIAPRVIGADSCVYGEKEVDFVLVIVWNLSLEDKANFKEGGIVMDPIIIGPRSK